MQKLEVSLQLDGTLGINKQGVSKAMTRVSRESVGSSTLMASIPTLHDPTPPTKKQRQSSGRPPRLSSEGAIRGSDLTNHLYCMGSPTSMPMRFPFRERASRVLPPASRPITDSLRQSSFERPLQQSTSKPFESPHPRNNWIAPQETPTLRQTVISCLET